MNEAAGKLGKEIIRQLIEKWSTAQSNFVKCYVVLKMQILCHIRCLNLFKGSDGEWNSKRLLQEFE